MSSTSEVTSQKPEAVTENKDKEKTEKIKHKEKDKEKGKEKESKREGITLKRNLAPIFLWRAVVCQIKRCGSLKPLLYSC